MCARTAADLSNQVMPGPSGTCPTYQYAPQLYPPLPHPMSMQFNTGLGDISVQSPTQWSAPYLPPYTHTATPETDSAFACVQETSVYVMDAGTNLIRRQNHHMICVYSMKSGVRTCPLQQTCLSQDLEMPITIQILLALSASGHLSTPSHWSSPQMCKTNYKLITSHFFLLFSVFT